MVSELVVAGDVLEGVGEVRRQVLVLLDGEQLIVVRSEVGLQLLVVYFLL